MKYMLFAAAIVLFVGIMVSGCAHTGPVREQCTSDPTYNGEPPDVCMDQENIRMCAWGSGKESESFYVVRMGCTGEWFEFKDDTGPSI